MAMFGRYLIYKNQIDWSLLEIKLLIHACEDNNFFLTNILSIGRAHNVPEKRYRFHNNDHPWTNEKHKRLINSDNEPLLQVNFKYYRNKVNRQRKSCLASFCISKVENLKQLNPNDWCREVKRVSGMNCNSNLKVT